MEGVGGLLPLEASHFKLTGQWQKAPDTLARDPTDRYGRRFRRQV